MFYNKNFVHPYFFMIMTTALLYLWQLHLTPMINLDGVTYIQATAAYLKGGISSATALNYQAKWPFYSMLIAGVHVITGTSIILAERILDASFIMMSACFFLYFARSFSQHEYASVWAIIIWLTWHAYVAWWPAIIRDHGFLTCLLASFYCYYRYSLTQKLLWALTWSMCLIVAEFFRIEAIVYLALLPFSVFFLRDTSFKRRWILWLKLNMMTLIAIACVVMLFLSKILTPHSLRFGYMWHEFSLSFSTIADKFMQNYEVMHKNIFFRENDFSVYALLASYAVVFFAYVIAQVSLAAVLPLFFLKNAWAKLNARMLNRSFLIYMGVAAIIPLFFFAEHVFLNERYLLPFGLFLLLLTASILPHVIESFVGKKKLIFTGLLGLLLAINMTSTIFVLRSATPDAMMMGQWLKKYYPNLTLFTNDRQILFYDSSPPEYKHGELHAMKWSGVGDVWLRKHDDWCYYDLLVISAPRDGTQALRKMFAEFQERGVIGPTIKRYQRVSDGEDVLVAPIVSDACIRGHSE